MIQYLAPEADLPRHRHRHAYVAIVLKGTYVEAGDRGRHQMQGGEVAFHGPFEAHRDCIGKGGAHVLNLPWEGPIPAGSFARTNCAGSIVAAAAAGDMRLAQRMLIEECVPFVPSARDWPEALAADLAALRELDLTRWAERNNVRPNQLASGFHAVFGITPKRFRAEAKARGALAALAGSIEPLAQVAVDAHFADQAHMSRAIRSLTGLTPREIRRTLRDHAPGRARSVTAS
jgi:AraC-like DNA-binding protein